MHVPPRPPPFPYTTLFRSVPPDVSRARAAARRDHAGSRAVVAAALAADPAGPRPARRRRCAAVSLLRPAVRRHRRSEEHTSELQSLRHLVCRLLLQKKYWL